MIKIIERIEKLTALSLEKKTRQQMFASLIEEVGELSRAIKIEEKVAGNTYKTLDEPAHVEVVDVFICVVCVAVCKNIDCSKIVSLFEKNYVIKGYIFNLLEDLFFEIMPLKHMKEENLIHLCYYVFAIYYNRGGKMEDFEKICHSKLDKWEQKL